jgi:hypothetical protein
LHILRYGGAKKIELKEVRLNLVSKCIKKAHSRGFFYAY